MIASGNEVHQRSERNVQGGSRQQRHTVVFTMIRTTLCLLSLLAFCLASQRGAYTRQQLIVRDDEDSGSDEVVAEGSYDEGLLRGRQLINQHQRMKNFIKNGYRAWTLYKEKHSKRYENTDVESKHMLAYLTNMEKARKHNLAYDQGKHTFEMGSNHISDLPYEEYLKLNGYRGMQVDSGRRGTTFLPPFNVDVPDHVDWRDHGYVTDVKNQGMCGSCWAFSATGSLEGQHMRKNRTLVSLSEQNLVDCSRKYGNNGCNGGLMDFAFQYIKENHGIDTETSYPYKGQDMKCHFNRRTVGAEDSGFVDVREDDEEQLKIAVATVGPISVAIDAGHPSFQMYRKGIYYEPECSPEDLDHGVLVVGYGSENDVDYWIVKNSWGESWGEKGYVRMMRNRKNHCGIASKASYPVV